VIAIGLLRHVLGVAAVASVASYELPDIGGWSDRVRERRRSAATASGWSFRGAVRGGSSSLSTRDPRW